MSSMNSRLKGFGFGKRKSTASIHPDQVTSNHSQTPPPGGPPQISQQFPSRPGPAPSIASTSSQQSLAQSLQMNHPGAGPRPPSYSANYPPGPPGPVGSTSPLTNQGPTRTPPSQMVGGPPPINTGGPPAGYPPPVMGGGPPPQGGPPGYAGGGGYPPPPPQQQPAGGQYGARNTAAEVEGNSRSKAQLIVGIDFVCIAHQCTQRSMLTIYDCRVPHSPVSHSPSLQAERPRKILSPSGRAQAHTPSRR